MRLGICCTAHSVDTGVLVITVTTLFSSEQRVFFKTAIALDKNRFHLEVLFEGTFDDKKITLVQM